jgi:hypothetical protein
MGWLVDLSPGACYYKLNPIYHFQSYLLDDLVLYSDHVVLVFHVEKAYQHTIL